MPKTKTQKSDLVKSYREKIKSAKAIYFIDASKIGAIETTEIKQSLYDLDSSYNVIKNRLFNIALEEEGMKENFKAEIGQNGAIFASEQGVSEAAKIITNFIKDKEKSSLKGGMLDGKTISNESIEELASLPSKEVMIARVLATMNAPVSGFVNVLAGNVRSIVNVINAIKDTKTA